MGAAQLTIDIEGKSVAPGNHGRLEFNHWPAAETKQDMIGGLVLEGTTGLPLWIGVALVTGVGVLYTFTGGIKAVIATDSIQYFAVRPA